MRTEMQYVELKTGHSDDGPAWIGRVAFSKSGATLYFNGRALVKSMGIAGNYRDIETGEEFWVSGVKKRGCNRHPAGGRGKIMLDEALVGEYLAHTGQTEIDAGAIALVSIPEDYPVERIRELENERAE